MKHLLTLIGLLVLTIGKAQLSFAPATNYGVGSSPSSLISADFDGDGKVDVVLGNFSIAPAFVKGAANWKQGPPFLVLKNIIKNW